MHRSLAIILTAALLLGPHLVRADDANPFTNEGGVTQQAPPKPRVRPDAVQVRVTEADCRRLVLHEPAPDVAYQPGVDVRGKEVAPADLQGSNTLGQKLLETEIAFDLNLNPLLFAGNPALAETFDEATVNFGRVTYDKGTGRMTLDGEPLTDPQQAAIVAACRERLR